jgi:hypothetical protein
MKKSILVLIVISIITIISAGCTTHTGPLPIETLPVTKLTAQYDNSGAWLHSIKTYKMDGVSYERDVMPYGTTITSTFAITKEDFDTNVYADTLLANTSAAYSVVATSVDAPADTVACYQSADGVKVFCENPDGIINLFYTRYYAVFGMFDADHSRTLISYTEE